MPSRWLLYGWSLGSGRVRHCSLQAPRFSLAQVCLFLILSDLTHQVGSLGDEVVLTLAEPLSHEALNCTAEFS